MTIGRVTAQKEAVIDLQVCGPTGQTLQIEVVIDTGFNGYLTLSTDMVDTLNLQFVCTTPAANNIALLHPVSYLGKYFVWTNATDSYKLLSSTAPICISGNGTLFFVENLKNT